MLFMFFFIINILFSLLYGYSFQLLVRKRTFMLSFFKSVSFAFLTLEPIYFMLFNVYETLIMSKTLNTLVPLVVVFFAILLF